MRPPCPRGLCRRTAFLVAAFLLASSGASRAADELTLLAWSEYVPRAVIDGFRSETQIEVHYETFSSNEEMLAKLLAGATRYDLIQPSDYIVEALVKAGELQALDPAKLPHLKNIGAEFRALAHDPELRFSVPYMAGTVGIVVNTEKVKEPVESYAEVFQEKYKRKILVLDDPLEIVLWAMATQGKSPSEVTQATIAATRPVLERWLPLVKIYDSDSPKTAFLGGDVGLGIVWSGEAAVLLREDKRFRYVLPREGAHRFVDTLAIPRRARNPEAAHRLIDYLLRPEVSVKISREFPYTNPNLEARKLLTDAERANPASYPPGEPKLESLRDIGELAAAVDKLVTEIKATASF